jgi:hypothetical protein
VLPKNKSLRKEADTHKKLSRNSTDMSNIDEKIDEIVIRDSFIKMQPLSRNYFSKQSNSRKQSANQLAEL